MGWRTVAADTFHWLDRWADAGLKVEVWGLETLRRVRLLSALGLVGFVSLFLVAAVDLLFGRVESAASMVVAAVVLVAVRRVLATGRVAVASVMVSAVAGLSLLSGVWWAGGADTSAMAWVPVVVGLFVFILGGLRAALATGLLFCGVLGIVLADGMGLVPVAAHHSLDVLVDVSGAGLALGGYVALFARDQRLAELRLAQSVARLEREVALRREAELAARSADGLKSRFLATMSHEIRTPLNGVLGSAQVLARSPLGPADRGLVQTIQGSGERLLTLLDNVLEVSRIQSGGLRLVSTVFSPTDAAADLLGMARERVAAQGLELALERAPGVPDEVRGDEQRFRQVLWVLLDNATRFTEQGAVRLRLAPEGAGLRVEVEDSGPGIDAGALDQLFAPFQQGAEGRLPRHGGSGLGLTIAKGLVDAMGGTIAAVNLPGAGASFRVVLPLIAEAVREEEEPTDRVAVQLQGGVLVVEDNPTNAQLMGLMLDALGVAWRRVENGHLALEAVAHQCPRLVLMDCQMPVMDGISATIELRRRGFRSPIVAVTASPSPENRAVCAAAGMDGFLTKPVNMERLEAALQRHLGEAPDRSDGVPGRVQVS